MGKTCNNNAQLQAISLGMIMAKQLELRNCVIQTDSKHAFDCIVRNKESAWNHKEVVDQIRKQFEGEENVLMRLIFREGNGAADLLAKIGSG